MKICILADVQSAHTRRWVRSISESGHELIVISFRPGQIEGIDCHYLRTPKILGISPSNPFWSRFHYLFAKGRAQRIVNEFDPDIVHAFWATSYGLLGARLHSKAFMVSVWGMDITDSPKNFIMKQVVKYALRKAQKIFCTSKFLLERTKSFVVDQTKLIHIPFGIDTELFKPIKQERNGKIVIGSTKSFEAKYGLMNLIKAFEQLSKRYANIELLLVGAGSLKNSAELYVQKKSLDDKVVFHAAVEVEAVPQYLNMMDIFVMPSISDSETFGVAALEASSCGLPVVASRIGGIPEVIQNNTTGFLIEHSNVIVLIETLADLIEDEAKRLEMGVRGRAFVQSDYAWSENVNSLISEYKSFLRK